LIIFYTLIDRSDWYFADYSGFAPSYTYQTDISVSPGDWAAITKMDSQLTEVTVYRADGIPLYPLEVYKREVFGMNSPAYRWVFSTLIPNYTPNIGEPP
jgi:hypothetical protein